MHGPRRCAPHTLPHLYLAGVGAIAVAAHLAPFLPGHPVVPTGGDGEAVVPKADLTVAAAPYGSALILPISWMYIRMLGEKGVFSCSCACGLGLDGVQRRP